jgi:glutamine synthetase
MVGSSQSTAGPNFVLNTIVADVVKEIADQLEKAKDVKAEAQKVLKKIATDHARIVFNGDNYSQEWVDEAAKRGLPNIRSTVESIETIMDKENVDVMKRHGVLTKQELHARTDILLENYSKTLNIEAGATLTIAKRQILPVCIEYCSRLAASASVVSDSGVECKAVRKSLEKVSGLVDKLSDAIESLESAVAKAKGVSKVNLQARSFRDDVVPAMVAVRSAADALEMIVDADIWPLPSYAEMLFLK